MNKSTVTRDRFIGLSSVTYGGTLTVTNLGGTLANGDSFQLFSSTAYSGAFTSIVTSLVNDLINPIIGLILGGMDFSNMYLVLKGTVAEGAGLKTARESGAAIFAYGNFLTAVINFAIIALVVFFLVKTINHVQAAAVKKKAPEPEAPKGPTELDVLLQIRDSLKK